MTTPNPRRDKQDVPFCRCHCDAFKNCRGTRCALQPVDRTIRIGDICLPQIWVDYARLKELEQVGIQFEDRDCDNCGNLNKEGDYCTQPNPCHKPELTEWKPSTVGGHPPVTIIDDAVHLTPEIVDHVMSPPPLVETGRMDPKHLPGHPDKENNDG